MPALEANHALRGAIEEALLCKRGATSKAILFNLYGHGHFDVQAYMNYAAGKLEDKLYDPAELEASLSALPDVKMG